MFSGWIIESVKEGGGRWSRVYEDCYASIVFFSDHNDIIIFV